MVSLNLLLFLWQCSVVVSIQPDEFLAKFHQNDYKVKFERAESVSFDETLMRHCKVVTFKYNRTAAVLNATFEFKRDLINDFDVIVQAYKFMSNEYRSFPIRFRVNVCDAWSLNVMGVQNAITCGNFTGCPLYKDRRYHVCNFQPDESKFPPLIPSGSYMVEISFAANKHGRYPFMIWRSYATVFRLIK